MRNTNQTLLPLLLPVFFVLACTTTDQAPEHPQPCTDAWYPYVESTLSSGDGMGHGPDIGSEEWQSVIEFKLGIRGDANVPERSSPAWCRFIDEQLQKR